MSGNVQKDQSVSHVICFCSSHFQPDFYLNSGLHGLKVTVCSAVRVHHYSKLIYFVLCSLSVQVVICMKAGDEYICFFLLL